MEVVDVVDVVDFFGKAVDDIFVTIGGDILGGGGAGGILAKEVVLLFSSILFLGK